MEQIKKTELRIGNYVERTAGIMPVIALSTERAWFDDGDGVAYKYLLPIPLTDEVLRAAGFTYDDSDDENRWLSLYVKLFRFEADQSTEFKEVYAYREKGFITKVTTLHQLQNLYFALTGSELEVSLIGNSPIRDK